MESLHIEPVAMIMIASYCTQLKDKKVGYPYVLKVAKSWAYDGITTAEKVEERLKLQEASDSDMTLVLRALGSKKAASVEDYESFINWTKGMGFELDVILHLAKYVKKAKGGSVAKLDTMLLKFYSLILFSVKEIDEYLQNEQHLYDVAKLSCRNIGAWYDNLDVVVETYINSWVGFGYDSETLNQITKHCFVLNVRTLEGVNQIIVKFFKLGLITMDSIVAHLQGIKAEEEKIQPILQKLGLVRRVTEKDRSFYNTWVYTWNTSPELLDYAIELSADKVNPLQFLNKLLSIYFTKNIKTVEDAKAQKIEFESNSYTQKNTAKVNPRAAAKHEYTKEELSSLITSIDEVEFL